MISLTMTVFSISIELISFGSLRFSFTEREISFSLFSFSSFLDSSPITVSVVSNDIGTSRFSLIFPSSSFDFDPDSNSDSSSDSSSDSPSSFTEIFDFSSDFCCSLPSVILFLSGIPPILLSSEPPLFLRK